MRIRFWGVRGTIPTPGKDTVKLGGNTSCVEVLTSDGQLIILDAGSGIRRLGMTLIEEFPGRLDGTILISHTHWDHIQGFPFFAPLVGDRGRNNRFLVIGPKRVDQQLENVLAGQIIEPYLPFVFEELTAEIQFKEVLGGDSIVLSEKTTIHVKDLRHPGGCLGFRIENEGRSFAYCTDSSHEEGRLTQSVLDLCAGVDLMVHDAQFTIAQREEFPHFGHSSWKEATAVAASANAGCLALFHYDPDSSDEEMEQILIQARQVFPRTILAYEGLEIELPLQPG